jgi:uncharacterized BrkB/YihY/UPF0761 family membrane protein
MGTTLLGVMCGVLGLSALLGLPVMISAVGLWRHRFVLFHSASMAMLAAFFFATVLLLYRYRPLSVQRRRIVPGALLVTGLWPLALEALTFCVPRICSFGMTYGPLGAAVGIMLWFYVSACATLLGGRVECAAVGILKSHRLKAVSNECRTTKGCNVQALRVIAVTVGRPGDRKEQATLELIKDGFQNDCAAFGFG